MKSNSSASSAASTLGKRSIAIVFVALLWFVALVNTSGQSASTNQITVVKMRTLQIDAWTRPGVGQFAPADDDVQHLVYELFVTNWNAQDLRFATVDVEDSATGKRLARFDRQALAGC